MRITNIEINTDMKTILDKLIFEIKNKGLTYFSKGYKNTSDYYMVQCPYHKLGKENHPSAQFRKSDGLFYCFNCKQTHNLPSVISYCLNVNGKAWLLDNFDGVAIEDRKVELNLPSLNINNTPKYIDKEILKQYRFTHPYMFKRKLTLDIIRKFDVGYDKNFIVSTEIDGKTVQKNFGECITFPVKDEFGNILFIARRSINSKLFYYPNNVDKPIYGLYEIYREINHGVNIDTVYVCESMINCLTLWSWGKYAVALNGTGSKKQYEMLKKSNLRYLILALDPDSAGRKGTKNLINNITNKIITVINIPEGKDVNDLSKEEFENLTISSTTEWLQ